MTSAPSISRTDDLAACHAIRRAVFIEEQAVPEDLEIDDLDGEAIHLLAVTGGRAVGTARILLAGETGKIGRVAVLADQRGTGLGAALIRAALDELRAQTGISQGRMELVPLAMQVLRELAHHCGHADILREQILAARG